jgi:hypothetical protein
VVPRVDDPDEDEAVPLQTRDRQLGDLVVAQLQVPMPTTVGQPARDRILYAKHAP